MISFQLVVLDDLIFEISRVQSDWQIFARAESLIDHDEPDVQSEFFGTTDPPVAIESIG